MIPNWLHSPHPELPRGHRFDGAGHTGTIPTPRPLTSPPGLWAPAPEVVVKPKHRAPRTPRVSTVKSATPRTLAPHGTDSAYKRHIKTGDPSCQPCRDAHNAENRGRFRNRSQAVHTGCGTAVGWELHKARKERLCDKCRTFREGQQ